jgi:hypothetical protein
MEEVQVSKQNFLEYIAHLSYELSLLAKTANFTFGAYILSIIHLESSKEIGQYPFEKIDIEQEIEAISPDQIKLHIFSVSKAMASLAQIHGMGFITYLFQMLYSEFKTLTNAD